HGLSGGAPLLVAQDHGTPLPGDVGAGRGGDRLRRLQPHVLPAVHPRLPGHAPALPRVSRGVPGPERDVLRGGVDPRPGLPAPDDLPRVVDAVRAAGLRQPVAGERARVADGLAAHHRELRAPAGGERRGLRLRPRGGGPSCLAWPTRTEGTRTAITRTSSITSRASPRRKRPPPSACGCSS